MTSELTATTQLHEQNSPGERRPAGPRCRDPRQRRRRLRALLDMLGLDAEPTR